MATSKIFHKPLENWKIIFSEIFSFEAHGIFNSYSKTVGLNSVLRFNTMRISMILKKAIVITALLLLLIVPSAIAIPKTKEPKPKTPKTPKGPKMETVIIAETATMNAGNIYLGNQEIDDAGILHVQGALSTGKISSGGSPISGFEIQTSLSGILDLNTYLGSYHGQWMITGQGGTFEGTINGKVEVTIISGNFVGHGTGDFESQKIKGIFEGSVNNFQIEITIQATITS